MEKMEEVSDPGEHKPNHIRANLIKVAHFNF